MEKGQDGTSLLWIQFLQGFLLYNQIDLPVPPVMQHLFSIHWTPLREHSGHLNVLGPWFLPMVSTAAQSNSSRLCPTAPAAPLAQQPLPHGSCGPSDHLS